MRNLWVLLQLGGFLLIILPLVGGFYTIYSLRGYEYQLIHSIIYILMIIALIAGIFLIVLGGIKYRQKTKEIKEQGKNSSNPLL